MGYTFVIAETGYGGYAAVDISPTPLSERGRWMGAFKTGEDARKRVVDVAALYGEKVSVGFSDRNANDIIKEVE